MQKSQLPIIIDSVRNSKLDQEFHKNHAKICFYQRLCVCLMDKLNTKLSNVFCMHMKHVLLQGGVSVSQRGWVGQGWVEMGWSSSLPSVALWVHALRLQGEGQM